MPLNDDIADAVISHHVDLMRYSEDVRQQVAALLTDVADDIRQQIERADIAGITRAVFRIRRQDALLKQIQDTLATAYGQLDEKTQKAYLDMANLQPGFFKGMIDGVIGAEVASVVLTPEDLKTIVSDVLIQGAPSADWWAKQDADTEMRFATQIRIGVAQGETNQELLSRVIGRKTGRDIGYIDEEGKEQAVAERMGGVLDLSVKQATALVRTSVQTISNQVLLEMYKGNEKLLKGVQWLAVLDGRTTPTCRGLDGNGWDWEGNPFPTNTFQHKFPGAPPIHWCCRSALVPVVKSWKELGAKGKNLPDVPPGTRSSMDGRVAATMNYEDWLKTKSVEFQKEVLGPARYNLWSKGKLTLAQMLDATGNPLTIVQLQAKISGN